MIGQAISHYRITAKLGTGGMGEVYLASDTKLNRNVALKFLAESLQDDTAMRARFICEAQAAAALNHPNIVPIYEVAEYEGRPFFAMEYVSGDQLQSLIAGDRLPWDRIRNIATQICEGLRAAHAGGIIHGDIKPSNVLIDQTGRVRLVDFGLARTMTEGGASEQEVALGTIAYASPEQLQGGRLSPASDLFSLGIILYQMITGQQPFTGRYEAAVIHTVVNVVPPPVSSARPDVPAALEMIATRLLQKKPADRYQNAADVLIDLQGTDAGTAKPDEGTGGRRVTRRYAAFAVLLVSVAVLAYTLGWFSTGGIPESNIHRTLAVLPFENLGPPDDEYFADGMTDAITMHLLRLGDISVISRSSSMQYKRSEKSIREIGTELGADCLLMGAVQKLAAGETDRVRISARLVRVDDGAALWAKTYEPPLQEVFNLQTDIGERVTRALRITVGDEGTAAVQSEPTENLEAYDLYLRGNEYYDRDWDRETIQIAIDFYQRAIALDSGFAAAFAMLARGHASMYSENYDRSEVRLAAAAQAAQRALALEPNSPEAHLAMGYYYYASLAYADALAEFAIVKTMQPNNRHVYNAIAAAQRRQGNLADAVTNFIRAQELDPRSHLRAFDVALTYGMMRNYAKAEVYLERAILLAPDLPLPYAFQAWLAILNDGDIDRAKSILDRAYGRVALSTSKYYWWLARIVEPDLENAIRKARPGTDTIGYYLHCAQINRLLGRHDVEREYGDSALGLLESRAADLEGQAWYHSQLSLAYTALRQKEQAEANGMRAVELLPTSQELFDALFLVASLAEVRMVFNEYDLAIDRLEELLHLPGFVSVPYLRVDPLWIPLHDHPRFQQLLRRST
jgi:serine/threonine protein kinase/tetratricopeptide (TPR) repeat protein